MKRGQREEKDKDMSASDRKENISNFSSPIKPFCFTIAKQEYEPRQRAVNKQLIYKLIYALYS